MRTLILALAVAASQLTPATAPTPALTWAPCPDGGGPDHMECATLTVPLDWSDPGGRKVSLAVGRLKATGPSQGTVLVNYGGPGAPGIEVMSGRLVSPGTQPFDQLRQRMDIVTWDPRGYGLLGNQSKPAIDWSCLPTAANPGMPAPPTTPAQFDQLARDNAVLANACREQDPELFDHMDTMSNVHDMDAIRRALGQSKINLYMGSYGGVYGQTYADLYPEHVRTMVLDGTEDHGERVDRLSEDLARDNVVRLQRFSDWCAGEQTCALHGQDVRQVMMSTFTDWNSKLAADARLLAAGRKEFPRLATDIAKAAHGDRSGFAPFRRLYPASECHDWPATRSLADLTAAIAEDDRIDPVFGAAGTFVPYSLMCLGWPAALNNPSRPLPHGVPPLLAVGTWGDFPMTSRVAARVPGSGWVHLQDAGHEVYAAGNQCVIALVDKYFLTGVPPKAEC
jgi:pimeloyl-ACP methyl ester carboxylesterase